MGKGRLYLAVLVRVFKPLFTVRVIDLRVPYEEFLIEKCLWIRQFDPSQSLNPIVNTHFGCPEVWYPSTDRNASPSHDTYVAELAKLQA